MGAFGISEVGVVIVLEVYVDEAIAVSAIPGDSERTYEGAIPLGRNDKLGAGG